VNVGRRIPVGRERVCREENITCGGIEGACMSGGEYRWGGSRERGCRDEDRLKYYRLISAIALIGQFIQVHT
jgi:hypothetical protein